jgi:hypothetical protein
MKLSFRQGIVKCSVNTSNSPNCYRDDILPTYVSLDPNHSSVLITFAHNESNYLYEDSNTVNDAWGPFLAPISGRHWLYWDINMQTGIRTFGHTSLEPLIQSTKPNNPNSTLHWYDTSRNIMFVYENNNWVEKIRVFACIYDGISIQSYALGTQVNDNTDCLSGYILFDSDGYPLTRKNGSQFVTTESNLYTTKSVIDPVDFSSSLFYAAAQGHIPEYSVVSFYKDNKIQLSSCFDPEYKSAIGMIRTEVYDSEVSGVVSNGYITNINWHFNELPSTAVYLGNNGTIQTSIPSTGFIQKIGTIVSSDTIFIDIDPQIIYQLPSDDVLNLPVTVDLYTGKLYTTSNSITNLGGLVSGSPSNTNWLNLGGWDADGLETLSYDESVSLPPGTPTALPTAPSGGTTVVGFTYRQTIPSIQWTLDHGQGTTNAVIQITDDLGSVLSPTLIKIVNGDRIIVSFDSPASGTAQILLTSSTALSASTSPTVVSNYVQTAPASVWKISHGLGYMPIVRSYVNGILTIPNSIVHDSTSDTTITFAGSVAGRTQLL